MATRTRPKKQFELEQPGKGGPPRSFTNVPHLLGTENVKGELETGERSYWERLPGLREKPDFLKGYKWDDWDGYRGSFIDSKLGGRDPYQINPVDEALIWGKFESSEYEENLAKITEEKEIKIGMLDKAKAYHDKGQRAYLKSVKDEETKSKASVKLLEKTQKELFELQKDLFKFRMDNELDDPANYTPENFKIVSGFNRRISKKESIIKEINRQNQPRPEEVAKAGEAEIKEPGVTGLTPEENTELVNLMLNVKKTGISREKWQKMVKGHDEKSLLESLRKFVPAGKVHKDTKALKSKDAKVKKLVAVDKSLAAAVEDMDAPEVIESIKDEAADYGKRITDLIEESIKLMDKESAYRDAMIAYRIKWKAWNKKFYNAPNSEARQKLVAEKPIPPVSDETDYGYGLGGVMDVDIKIGKRTRPKQRFAQSAAKKPLFPKYGGYEETGPKGKRPRPDRTALQKPVSTQLKVDPKQRGKVVKNKDGTTSSERTITIEMDGKHYIIPTLIDGVQKTNDEAVELFRIGKTKAVGVANTAEEADRMAKERSKMLGEEKKSKRTKPIAIRQKI